MSRWRAAVCALAYLGATTCAKAGSVRVEPIQPCSRQPRITVLRDGKPAPEITVELYREDNGDNLFATLRTDAKGEVVLPKLSRAQIAVVASWNSGSVIIPNLRASVAIQYHPDDPKAQDHFTMELAPYPQPGEAARAAFFAIKAAKAAETKPNAEVRQFSGVVAFPDGSGIPDVSVAVVRLHVAEPRPLLELHTDAEGRFSAQLPPGDYVAAFTAEGWQVTVQAVTINPAAKQKEMQIALRPVTSTT